MSGLIPFKQWRWTVLLLFMSVLFQSAGAVAAVPGTGVDIISKASLSWYSLDPASTPVASQQTVSVSAQKRHTVLAASVLPSVSSMQTFVPGGTQPRHFPPAHHHDDNGVLQPSNPGLGGTLSVIPTAVIFPGAPVYLCVSDADQNLDPAVADTLEVQIASSANPNKLRIQLTETANGSGEFCGYFSTTDDPANASAQTMWIAPGDTLTLIYEDPSDPADWFVTSLRVASMINRVLDGGDGSGASGIAGVSVTLIDRKTGAPAEVLNFDGTSGAANPVTTNADGEFIFPYVAQGNYEVRLGGFPVQYRLPEDYEITDLVARFAGLDKNASFGKRFTLGELSPVGFDMVLVPKAKGLYVTIKGDNNDLAYGDLTQVTVTVENLSRDEDANGVELGNLMPQGLRYQKDSLTLDGARLSNPSISDDGNNLVVPLGSLKPGQRVSITYVGLVTPLAPLGKASNRAQASGQSLDGSKLLSNLAQYQLTIRDDLMSGVNTLIGNVLMSCDRSEQTSEQIDLSGIRVLLETGRYAITDRLGRFHFSELENGTHVVQVDKASLPAGFELVSCEQNSRFAGRNFSQFVELHGGALWRADFYLQPIALPTGNVSLQLHQRARMGANEVVDTFVDVKTAGLAVDNLTLVVLIDKTMVYQPGSSLLDGEPVDDPVIQENRLVYALGKKPANQQFRLTFAGSATMPAPNNKTLVSRASVQFSTDGKTRQQLETDMVALPLMVGWEKHRSHYEIQYASGAFDFKPLEDDEWNQLVNDLGDARDVRLKAIGHTDSIQVRPGARFKNNQELSVWRANSFVDYLTSLGMTPDQSTVDGAGQSRPLATNTTVEGRAQNRRVEVDVQYEKPVMLSVRGHASSAEVNTGTVGQLADFDTEQVPTVPVYNSEEEKSQREFSLDRGWLNATDSKSEIVWPAADATPSSPATWVAVKHARGETVTLFMNDREVSQNNFAKQDKSRSGAVVVSQWLGVSLQTGPNLLEARVIRNGKVVTTVKREVHYGGSPVRAQVVKEQSWLVADGRHNPFVAVKLFDRWGKPARPGQVGAWSVNSPYTPWVSQEEMQRNKVIAGFEKQASYVVGNGGIAYFELAPTTNAGRVDLVIPMKKGDEKVSTWIEPKARDWVLVGLGAGTLTDQTVHKHMQGLRDDQDDDIWIDDRVAFYAKGSVKGNWLITAAYDTAKQSGVEPQGLEQVVDPNKYYMLYADASQSGYDASSSKKLYLKLERRQFYALFGDYSTGLTLTDLSAYERRFTGVKAGFDGEHVGFTAFGAHNTQSGAHDEIQGNGTSGLYQLSHRGIIMDSDNLRLVTRDRFNNEVIHVENLSRFTDYNLNYVSGQVFFRRPVPDRDASFNPIYIVADYEVDRGGKNATTAGGRAYAKLANDTLEIGTTVVQEGSPDGNNDLVGVDITGKLTDTLTLKAEAAQTRTRSPGTASTWDTGADQGTSNLSDHPGDAYQISLEQQSEKLQGKMYYKKVDDGFGLGQQSLGDVGVERYGWDGNYNLNKSWALTSSLDRQNGQTANSMKLEAGSQYNMDKGSVRFGARHTRSDSQTANETSDANGHSQSDQLYLGANRRLSDKLSVHGETSQNVGSDRDVYSPASSRAGLDYALTRNTNLFANQTWAGQGAAGYYRMTEIGVNARHGKGTKISSSVAQQETEYGPRVYSTSGLSQDWRIDEHWSASAGMSRSQTIRHPSRNVAEKAPSAYADTQDFTSAFLGSGYQNAVWQVTNRIEWLGSRQEERYGLFGGAYRALSAGAGVASSLSVITSDFKEGGDALDAVWRLGYAWRPLKSNWAFLNQLDLIYSDKTLMGARFNSPVTTGQESPSTVGFNAGGLGSHDLRNWRLVNNFNVNYKRQDARWQVSGYYGAKYARYNFNVGDYESYTDLIGLETRFDLTRHWDIGVHGNKLTNYETHTHRSSYGVETGYDIATNLWISLGYNFVGFYDRDFSAAHYTVQGPYLRFRFKFDQDTLKALAQGWR